MVASNSLFSIMRFSTSFPIPVRENWITNSDANVIIEFTEPKTKTVLTEKVIVNCFMYI